MAQAIEGAHAAEHSTLATLLAGEKFWPTEPHTLKETGLAEPLVEGLICKYLLTTGKSSGRKIAENVALPFAVLEPIFANLRTRQLVVHAGSAPLGDYYYTLTEEGRKQAQAFQRASAYVGPAPVPLADYVISVEAQAISDEAIRRDQLEDAFSDISVDPDLLDLLGPAVNSAAGMFLYGAPGNGKSTLAGRMTACFGQEVWIPYTVVDGNDLLKLYDPAYHQAVETDGGRIMKSQSFDRRWVRVRRPTVVVGGELTMDNLEIRHDPRSNVSEAPLQMKSNCGCLLIDDFGRQRVSPAELLNRWIVPLENKLDYLTLATGKKIQVPFEQLIIFSTNLDPSDLVDEAFLRRIPYKIEIGDPAEGEFHRLFQLCCEAVGCEYREDAVEYLLDKHYRGTKRPLRRCHPRDIMQQVRNYCTYNGLPLAMCPEYFDRVAGSFFTVVLKK